jgi:hypothetical protein
MLHMKFVGMFIISPFCGSLVITVKQDAEYKLKVASILLFYIVHKCYVNRISVGTCMRAC